MLLLMLLMMMSNRKQSQERQWKENTKNYKEEKGKKELATRIAKLKPSHCCLVFLHYNYDCRMVAQLWTSGRLVLNRLPFK
jgi:hypothetical protein